MKKIAICILAMMFCFMTTSSVQAAVEKKNYKVCWSHYVGWEQWQYANFAGILKKWADKYKITIELSEPIKYGESLGLFTGGAYDACVMTNMDMLISPAVGGVDSEVAIIGDSSDGNDGVVVKSDGKVTLQDVLGRDIHGAVNTVTHYLIFRWLIINGKTERDIRLIDGSEEDLVAVFDRGENGTIVATWNPFLMSIRNQPRAQMIFDSSQLPGEILDLMVVRTEMPDTLKKALTGAWYEVMAIMNAKDKRAKDARAYMAQSSGSTLKEFEAQLKTTAMFYNPADALAFAKRPEFKQTMEYVRAFCFDHGLYPRGAKSKDVIGIQMPDGSILGNPKNIKMRFNMKFMEMAAKGEL